MKKIYRLFFLILYISVLFFEYFPSHDNFTVEFYSCREINCSDYLVDLMIKYPQHQCAFYDLDDQEIYNHIDEGVIFEDNYEEKYSSLRSVSSKGLMHNKFCVFNEQFVLSGSWNPTQRGTNFNDNYIVLIDSKKIAKKYFAEYKYIQERNNHFKPLEVYYNNSKLNLYFCPQHDCQKQILNALSHANHSIKILAFTFTDELIAEKLLSLSKKNINIEIIYEKTRITKYSTIHTFEYSAIKTYLDGNPYTMHEKLIIIDEDVVILGSYNPTKGATQRNDENILIIKDSSLAKDVLHEYWRVFSLI